MSNRTNLFGIEIDILNMTEAVNELQTWVSHREKGQRCRFVVTPNVDHAVLYQENEKLRDAYANADMVLADGHPIVWASRLLGSRLPERVAGSELVPRLFDATSGEKPLRVFLLGAADGVAARAAEKMKAQWPNVETVGVYSPPMGFEKDAQQSEIIIDLIAKAAPEVVIVGLGAPKQEIWVNEYRDRIPAAAALCVGATIDFLAGEKKRAPVWMQRGGVEWLHRMCSEPKRLVKRYAKDAWIFPQLVMKQMFSGWAPNRVGGN
jgi:N-acetylglucosaminyldiphosphoundecaprenol N-acetyl-beta-D-mannosaminyltransferase